MLGMQKKKGAVGKNKGEGPSAPTPGSAPALKVMT